MTVQGGSIIFGKTPIPHVSVSGLPSYEEAELAARDQLLAIIRSKICRAHLEALEYDVNELAKRPGFLSQHGPWIWQKESPTCNTGRHQIGKGVRELQSLPYQDRLLYGTDLRAGASDIQENGIDGTRKRNFRTCPSGFGLKAIRPIFYAGTKKNGR